MQDCTSINQLGRACGVTHRTASNWLRRKDFPLQREAPWSADDINEIKAWRESRLQPNRADPEYQGRITEPPADEQDKDYWLMRKYRAQALQQEGKLLDTDAVMGAWSRTIGDYRDQMAMVAASVQGLLALTDEQTKQLDNFIRDTHEGVADSVGKLAEDSRTIQPGGEGVQVPEAPATQRVGREPQVHASVDDGLPRPLEE